MMKCPLGSHRVHTGPYAPEHWVRDKEALRRHLYLVHHVDLKEVLQPEGTVKDKCFPLEVAHLSRPTRRLKTYSRPEKTGVEPQPPAGPVPLLSLKTSALSSTSFCSTASITPLHPPSTVQPLVSISAVPRRGSVSSEKTPSNQPDKSSDKSQPPTEVDFEGTVKDKCFPLEGARLSRRARRLKMYSRPEKTGVEPLPPVGPVPLSSLKTSALSSTSFSSTPSSTPLHPPSTVQPPVSISAVPRRGSVSSEKTPSNQPDKSSDKSQPPTEVDFVNYLLSYMLSK